MDSEPLNLSARKRGKSCTICKLWNSLIARLPLVSRFSPGLGSFVGTGGRIGEEEAEKGNAGRRQTEPATSGDRCVARGNHLHSKEEAQEERHAELVCSTGDGRASGFAGVRSREERRSQWRVSPCGEGCGSEQRRRKRQDRRCQRHLCPASHTAADAIPRRTAARQGHTSTRPAGSA